MSKKEDPVGRIVNNFFKEDEFDKQFKTESRRKCEEDDD